MQDKNIEAKNLIYYLKNYKILNPLKIVIARLY